MTPKELIINIAQLYRDARIPHIIDKKISRGRSHSVSSLTEDLFAHFLISNDKTIDKILVDQSISFPEESIKTIYPDITIIKQGIATNFIDLKMDMGWNRDGLLKVANKHFESVKSMQGHTGRYYDGISKEKFEFKVGQDASYDIVIISDTNINAAKLSEQLNQCQSLTPITEAFVLYSGGHPNTYEFSPEELGENLTVNQSNFDKLLTKIKH